MSTSRAREAFHTVRKEEILDAAMGVLVRQGADASLQEIAEAAGITRGALYRYFPSREDLVRECFARCFESTKTAMAESLSPSGSPAQALMSLVAMSAHAYREQGAREGMILNLQAVLATATGPSSGEPPQTVIDKSVVDEAIQLARQASDAGEFSSDVDPVGLALLVISALQGLQLLIAMFDTDIDSAAATDTLIAIIASLRS
jgi:TetR/AcrR family transcriptional regulator, fatty acid metabolism regulator protein